MADTKGYVQITDEQLAKSAVKYRKELLMMPVLAMASTCSTCLRDLVL